jgi:hypothetical protein
MLGTVALSKQREPTGLSDFCRWHAGYKLPLIATFMCLHGSGASTNHVSVPDSSQKPASRPALVSHRARLVLPEADLSQLELTVQQRLRAGEANLVSLITQPTVSEKDLAEAYGHLGSLCSIHMDSAKPPWPVTKAPNHSPQRPIVGPISSDIYINKTANWGRPLTPMNGHCTLTLTMSKYKNLIN